MSEKPPADSPTAPADSEAPSPWVAAVLAWLIPGAGHFYIGYNGKALLFLVAVLGLMLFGSALGDWKIVVPPDASKTGEAAADNLWFGVHLCAGLVTLVFAGLNKGLPEGAAGAGALVEVGHLYTRVAGMLNLLLIMDAMARAAEWGRKRPADEAAAPAPTAEAGRPAATPPAAPVPPAAGPSPAVAAGQ
jgi:TM2 domain-containing membrane protein YozV